MRRLLLLLCLMVLGGLPTSAQVCGRADVQGAYGFQLSGITTIGVDGPQPQAAIGRLVFGADGVVSGVASVDLNGYFLGNPVTGTYEFKTDCTLTFQLQDDSGAFQHFSGVAKEGGASVEFHQGDTGAGGRGVLEKTPDGCKTESFHGSYAFALSGTASQFATDQPAGSVFSVQGTVDADGAGNLAFTTASGKTTGSYQLDSDCIAEIELGMSNGDSSSILKLRGVLVNEGKRLLAVESDPARTATARFTAK
ncbi:MAG: hypothetical protein ACLQOO_10105 [Terriglobia bacterium]